MPDKSQNINIRYNFNDAAIEKTNALLAKANAATNQLQSSASKGGSAIQQEFSKSNKTILDMQNTLTRLKSSIEITSDPKKLARLSGEYQTMKKSLDEATKSAYGLDKATAKAAGGVNGMVLGFRDFSRVVGAGIILTVTRQIVDLALEMSTLSGQVAGVERGFNTAFANSAEVLQSVRDATHGTITDFDLMKRTLQATNLGVGVEHLGVLFEFAAARAQQTGESVDYLVDSIVRGIGRKSPLVLDNLGISVTALKEKFNGASLASQTVAEATRGVAEIAAEQLTKMGGFVETSETKVKALGVAFETFRIDASKAIDFSPAIESITDFVNGARKLLFESQLDRRKDLAQFRGEIEFKSLLQTNLNANLTKDEQKLSDAYQAEIAKRLEARKKNLVQLAILEEKFNANRDKPGVTSTIGLETASSLAERERTRKAIQEQITAIQLQNKELGVTGRLLQDAFNKLNAKEPIRDLDTMREELKALIDGFDHLATSGKLNVFSKEQLDQVVKIKDLRKEIENIEALLKDPKTLEIKVKGLEDDTLERLMKFFGEGGTLKGKVLNPSTGEIFSPDTASETFDLEKLNQDGAEAAESVTDSFWTRFRLAFKRKSTESSPEMQQDLQEALVNLEVTGIGILADQFSSIADVEANTFQARIRRTREFYEEQMTLAGNNEKAKDQLRIIEDRKIAKLRRQQFEAEQKAARQKAVIDGAAALLKTFAVYGFTPAAAIAAVGLAAVTASQIAIIDRQTPRFAKGVIGVKGPGTGTSDSIPAYLSKGESVMTAWETKNAGNVFKEVRAKKLDDKVLKSLKLGRQPVGAVFNDEKIIKAIKENKPPDILLQSGIAYEARKKSEDYINKVRAKSVRI